VAITGAASVEPVEPVAGGKEEHVEESSLKASAPSLVKKGVHVDEGKEGGDGQEDKEDDNEDDDDEIEDEDLDLDDGNGSDYAPIDDGSEGTINLSDDTLAADNLPDKVKPGQKVSSPFDLPILPIARTLLVKKGKKGKKVHDGDDESVLLLSNEECVLKKKKGKSVTKLPAAGSSSKVGTDENSSKDVLMMIKGVQEEFLTFLGKVIFHLHICFCNCMSNCLCKLFSKCFCICFQC
jgi:hypothetical protein